MIIPYTTNAKSECDIRGDRLGNWSLQLDNGLNTNWTGWNIEFEKYITECEDPQILIDMGLR